MKSRTEKKNYWADRRIRKISLIARKLLEIAYNNFFLSFPLISKKISDKLAIPSSIRNWKMNLFLLHPISISSRYWLAFQFLISQLSFSSSASSYGIAGGRKWNIASAPKASQPSRFQNAISRETKPVPEDSCCIVCSSSHFRKIISSRVKLVVRLESMKETILIRRNTFIHCIVCIF